MNWRVDPPPSAIHLMVDGPGPGDAMFEALCHNVPPSRSSEGTIMGPGAYPDRWAFSANIRRTTCGLCLVIYDALVERGWVTLSDAAMDDRARAGRTPPFVYVAVDKKAWPYAPDSSIGWIVLGGVKVKMKEMRDESLYETMGISRELPQPYGEMMVHHFLTHPTSTNGPARTRLPKSHQRSPRTQAFRRQQGRSGRR